MKQIIEQREWVHLGGEEQCLFPKAAVKEILSKKLIQVLTFYLKTKHLCIYVPFFPPESKKKVFYEDYFKGPYQSLRLMQALCGKVTLETVILLVDQNCQPLILWSFCWHVNSEWFTGSQI